MPSSDEATRSLPSSGRGRAIGHDFEESRSTGGGSEGGAKLVCRCGTSIEELELAVAKGEDSICVVWRKEQAAAGISGEALIRAIEEASPSLTAAVGPE